MPFACSDCNAKIEDGEQVCVWERESGVVFVRFICLRCYEGSDKYAEIDIFDE